MFLCRGSNLLLPWHSPEGSIGFRGRVFRRIAMDSEERGCASQGSIPRIRTGPSRWDTDSISRALMLEVLKNMQGVGTCRQANGPLTSTTTASICQTKQLFWLPPWAERQATRLLLYHGHGKALEKKKKDMFGTIQRGHLAF